YRSSYNPSLGTITQQAPAPASPLPSMAGLLPGVAPAAFSGEFPARLSSRNTSNSGSIPSLSENFGNAAAAAAAAVERGSGGGGGAHAGMPKKLLGPRPRGRGNASCVQAMEE
ncbi:unnamed protein product, partial [Ectocarpus sp. 12 AP-2014]